jgi:outer membrane protein TolC
VTDTQLVQLRCGSAAGLRAPCVAQALASHPEISEARSEVEKATVAVRLAKADIFVPDIYALARYSYQNQVPFLARNFGSFEESGLSFSFYTPTGLARLGRSELAAAG